MSAIEAEFLQDGAQPAARVAGELVAFVSEAQRTLDVAIYDFHARTGASASAADALEAAAARGVKIRVAFNVERSTHPAAPRPPLCDPADIDGLEVPTRGVHGEGALMHQKYVVRDGESVWTGSTNWTDDAFSREENAIVRVHSGKLAAAYEENFRQLWEHGRVDASGGSGPEVRLDHGVSVRAVFSPRGPSLAHLVSERIGAKRSRVRILTPVLSSGPILGTLAELAGRPSVDLAGAYDLTQMEEVQSQWKGVPANHWKIEAWSVIAPRLSGKRSTPYREGSVHDYMHAKILVVGDEVLTGSYNCSRGGEENAENLLHVGGDSVAERFAAFADEVAARYRA